MTALDLTSDPIELTRAIVDVPSVSGDEGPLADAVEAALREQAPHLEVLRDGNSLIARTTLGRPHRVVIAGHLDTVPLADNLPSRLVGERLKGCGTTDMKSGVAVALHLAAAVTDPVYDVSWLFYECEEVEAARNGLGRIEKNSPDWLDGDLAILMEPTHSLIEAGCQGTMRAELRLAGKRAHTARNWVGVNAIHAAAPVLQTLSAYEARRVMIDGCEYREGLTAVKITGGVAGNVVPDECAITVNLRFAPDRDLAGAEAHLREVFAGLDLTVTDGTEGALPGLGSPAAKEFVTAVGGEPLAKLGWTDVARFAARGVPALNFGPGDPLIAHTRDEWVDTREITSAAAVLKKYLAGG